MLSQTPCRSGGGGGGGGGQGLESSPAYDDTVTIAVGLHLGSVLRHPHHEMNLQ